MTVTASSRSPCGSDAGLKEPLTGAREKRAFVPTALADEPEREATTATSSPTTNRRGTFLPNEVDVAERPERDM
ncbi:MAG TPA: hypothetical protein VGB19_03655 [Actinomycetota bacterium]